MVGSKRKLQNGDHSAIAVVEFVGAFRARLLSIRRLRFRAFSEGCERALMLAEAVYGSLRSLEA
jgi:hypothetical protein